MSRVLLALLFLGLVGCDQVTKEVAATELAGEEPLVLVDGVLDLTYAENRDVGFGLLRWIPVDARQWVIGGLNLLALFLLISLWRSGAVRGLLFRAALVALVAGGVGNALDRVARGFVVDFMHLHHWPVFNVADVCLVFGVIAVAWCLLLRRPPPEATPTGGG